MADLELYLIRHGLAGEAGSYENDDERPLTDEGKKRTRQVAKRLQELGISFDLMLTSPLVRAKQTADILMDVGLAAKLQSVNFLAHGGTIDEWLTWLSSWRPADASASLALVGHEPDLSAWAELLIWGETSDSIVLKKAGVIGLLVPLEGSPIGKSSLFWLTPPKYLIG
jgi:phosphohistidine phosphatase